MQTVVIDLEHQLQQLADLPFGKTFARKPVQIVVRQVRNDHALVLAKGHGRGEQLFEIFGFQDGWAGTV